MPSVSIREFVVRTQAGGANAPLTLNWRAVRD